MEHHSFRLAHHIQRKGIYTICDTGLKPVKHALRLSGHNTALKQSCQIYARLLGLRLQSSQNIFHERGSIRTSGQFICHYNARIVRRRVVIGIKGG